MISAEWGKLVSTSHQENEMSQERLSMRKLYEVLRLKWEHGLSHRAIARSCGISPATVAECAFTCLDRS